MYVHTYTFTSNGVELRFLVPLSLELAFDEDDGVRILYKIDGVYTTSFSASIAFTVPIIL